MGSRSDPVQDPDLGEISAPGSRSADLARIGFVFWFL